MTDREILLAVREHAVDGIKERRKFADPLHKSDALFLVGYLAQVLKAILDECNMRTCECGREQVDGSGIMCGTCWVETSDERVASADQSN
jgi:hypothetical protein